MDDASSAIWQNIQGDTSAQQVRRLAVELQLQLMAVQQVTCGDNCEVNVQQQDKLQSDMSAQQVCQLAVQLQLQLVPVQQGACG